MWIKALFSLIIALPDLIAWFKMLQGAIEKNPIDIIKENRKITDELKKIPDNDHRKRAIIAKRISNLIRGPVPK